MQQQAEGFKRGAGLVGGWAWAGLLLLALAVALASMHAQVGAAGIGEMSVLLDEDGTLGIDDVARQDSPYRFTPVEKPRSLGYFDGTVWVKVTINAGDEAPQPRWLALETPLLDEATLYEPQPQGGYRGRPPIGAEHPFASRAMLYREPLFELDVLTGRGQVLYLRLRGDTSMIIAPHVWTSRAFIWHVGLEQLLMGAFIAAHILVFFSSLWFALSLHDRAHSLLAGFVALNLMHFLAAEGLAYQYLFPSIPGVSDLLMVLAWLPSLPLGSMFVLSYVGYDRPRRWQIDVYLAILWMVSLGCMALAWRGSFGPVIRFFQVWTAAQAAVHVLFLLRLGMRGNAKARLLLLSLSGLLAGTAFRMARNFGWLDIRAWTEYGFYVGFLGFLLVVNYVAIRRYQELREAREQAQAEALRLSKDGEARLEVEVTRRTAALNEALKLLETALGLEQQAREDERRLFATVSHELRTPLAVIDATALNLQLDMAESDEAGRLRCSRIRRATDQLAELVRSCCQEGRFKTLARGVHRESCNLRAMLYEAYDAARMISTAHNLHLSTDKLPATAICDPELTGLALRTLASNAAKYTPASTKVEIGGRLADGGLLLEVVDDGPGVSTEDLPNLFRRYYRGQNSTGVPGTGLGLSLAREMIELQGGSLTVWSQPQRGFAARIWLPSAQEADKAPADDASQGAAAM